MSEISLPIRERILYEFELGHNAATAARNICAARGEGIVSERTCQRGQIVRGQGAFWKTS
jgi:hypothetical protein